MATVIGFRDNLLTLAEETIKRSFLVPTWKKTETVIVPPPTQLSVHLYICDFYTRCLSWIMPILQLL